MFDDMKPDTPQENVYESAEQNSQDILEIPKQEATVEAKQEVATDTTAQEGNYARNLRVLREAKEKAERERNEAFRMLQERESQARQHQAPVQEDEELHLDPDAYAEGKHLSKLGKKIKKMEDQINSYHQQSSQVAAEAKIKAQYPDFDKVVTRDNLDLLRHAYPELAQTINSGADLYSKAISAYTLIKKFNIDTPMASEEETLKKNMAKPRSVASISPQQGDNPMSRANPFASGLTEDMKKQLYAEMVEAARNR